MVSQDKKILIDSIRASYRDSLLIEDGEERREIHRDIIDKCIQNGIRESIIYMDDLIYNKIIEKEFVFNSYVS